MKYIGMLLLVTSLYACKKPRNGNYTMEETGTTISTNCMAPPASTCITTNSVHAVIYEVKVDDSKRNSVKVDRQKWIKNKRSVYYYSSYTESTPGSSTNYSIKYEGNIKKPSLIEGTFTISTTGGSGSQYFSRETTGIFTLKRQQ